MKKNYTLTFLALFLATTFTANAQIKMTEVNPLTESITIKNFGSSKVNISSYRLCSRFSYGALSGMTVTSGNLDLEANAEVTITSSVNLSDASADLGLYLGTGSFQLASNMVDFLQWGAAGIGRESVANTAGLWTAGTFIASTVTPPYAYTGNGTASGVDEWTSSGSLSISELNTIAFSVFPNPTSEYLKLQLPANINKAQIELYSLDARSVVLKTELSPNNSIDVSTLASGVYFLKIKTRNEQGITKFIKQ